MSNKKNNTWIDIEICLPRRERFYKCLCIGFSKPIKCKFRQARNGPKEYSPAYFIYQKKIPYVKYWKEIL
jgi:hypothetical protein